MPRRTPLHAEHVEAGAKLVDFAGWEMPVSYAGVREEHDAVRTAAGIFDVSHMGEIEVSGPGALDLLQRLHSNDVSKLAIGDAQYSCLCRDDGGVLDDLFTYRLGEQRYLTVTNASNHEGDLAWVLAQAGEYDAEVTDAADRWAMIAVQGPAARALVTTLVEGDLPARMKAAAVAFSLPDGAGFDALVCGTGYTGEDGVEIMVDPEHAPALWRALASGGAVRCGLGARDTLRMEVCFHLYGNDLGTGRTPIAGGLGWCCREQTGFIGSEPIAAERADGPAEKLVAFEIEGRGIARQGNPVLIDGEAIGEVTSGTFSPTLERGIGMAYVAAAHAKTGTAIEIDVRGRPRSARIAKKPLYAKN